VTRTVLVVALLVGTFAVGIDALGTHAGFTSVRDAAGSFTAELCPEDECRIVHADSVDDYECNEDTWRFVINQIDPDEAPGAIHVSWSSANESVDRAKTAGKTVHYATDAHLDDTVEDATARVPDEWEGRFNLGEGPCHDNDGNQRDNGNGHGNGNRGGKR
jgi:hypothetical protein